MSFFDESNVAKAKEILARYPRPKSAILPLAHLAQDQNGWLSPEAMEQIAELTGTTAADVLAMIDLARRVVAADHVVDWAVRLVTATHPDRSPLERVQRYVRYGAGPRGVQAMVLCGKVRALLEGRVNLA